jgi:CO/xanthine dehydrogenase Mo-binding subunit
MVNDYLEELLAGNPNQTMTFVLKTGVKKDGTITAHHVRHYAACGAYAGYKPMGVIGGAIQAAGPYKIENVRIESANVYTNGLPGQIYRAPGELQGVFALESHLHEIARELGLDQVDFHMKNLVESGDEWAAGEAMEHVRVKETLQAALDAAGYDRPKAPFVGRGIAIGDRGAAGGQANLTITLNPDGSATIETPVFEQGTGTYTILSQVVAEELYLPEDAIEFEVGNTDSVPFDDGVGGSKQARISSMVAHEAAEATKKELIAFVARHMGWPEEELSFRGEEVWRRPIEESCNWRDLLRRTGETVTARAHINETRRPPLVGFAVQVAEVAVDPDTGEVRLLKFTTAHDVGQVLNTLGHQGQINGAVIQGIGFTLMEELKSEDGRVLNPSLGDYKIPTMRDIPPIECVLLPGETGLGPYGIKSIGETPIVPVAGAIANAVEDAIGVRIRELPITAEKVYAALQESRRAQS